METYSKKYHMHYPIRLINAIYKENKRKTLVNNSGVGLK